MIILLGMMIESNDQKTKVMVMMMMMKGGKYWMVMTRGRQCNLTHRSNQITIDRCGDDEDDALDDDDDHSFQFIVLYISMCQGFL